MIKTFKHKGLKDLHKSGKCKGIPSHWAKKLENILTVLNSAENIKDTDIPGGRLHRLGRPLLGYWSLDVSGNWRVTFRFEKDGVYDVDFHDTH